jgi:tRNA(Ile)-lysidine synthase TilS/MesJ
LRFFESNVAAKKLDGVLLAHHADDQAETVLLRILRGATLTSLGGMSPRSCWNSIAHYRPLLGIRRQALRNYLRSIGQGWREDSSNQSADYERNIVRDWLAREPELVSPLLALATAAQRWRNSLAKSSPALAEAFDPAALRVPPPLAEFAAGRWLIERGAPPDDISPATRQRLVAQALDPSAALRQHYPGGLLVRKRKKRIEVIPSPPIRHTDLQSSKESKQQHGQDQTAPAREL